jgi:hypothetical protein
MWRSWLPVSLLALVGALVPLRTDASIDVFTQFTSHIAKQVQADKQTFLAAQQCTEWFYRKTPGTPPRPPTERILFGADTAAEPCERRYPGGLEAARTDFSKTQSALSLSLTFYEFALVGDQNDDQRYSERELRDVLESFGLGYEGQSAQHHVTALTAQFDAMHRETAMELLMTGMGSLYDKGYRFTRKDRAALDQLSR